MKLEEHMAIVMTGNEIKEKLNGIPKIYYLNLNERKDKSEYMEKQFHLLEITNYQRISANKFSPKKFFEWKSEIKSPILNEIPRLSTLLNQLNVIVSWYDCNESEYCLIMEDDINFGIIKYWNFNWKYMMNRLPCNWDCVQFHIIGETYLPLGLTKRTRNNHSAACYLVNRNLASKIKTMFFDGEKYRFPVNYGYGDGWPLYHYQSADFIPYEVGVTYSFPIFITNSFFSSDSYLNSVNKMARKSDDIIISWWKNESKKYSLDDIFFLDSCKRKDLNVRIN